MAFLFYCNFPWQTGKYRVENPWMSTQHDQTEWPANQEFFLPGDVISYFGLALEQVVPGDARMVGERLEMVVGAVVRPGEGVGVGREGRVRGQRGHGGQGEVGAASLVLNVRQFALKAALQIAVAPDLKTKQNKYFICLSYFCLWGRNREVEKQVYLMHFSDYFRIRVSIYLIQ